MVIYIQPRSVSNAFSKTDLKYSEDSRWILIKQYIFSVTIMLQNVHAGKKIFFLIF